MVRGWVGLWEVLVRIPLGSKGKGKKGKKIKKKKKLSPEEIVMLKTLVAIMQ